MKFTIVRRFYDPIAKKIWFEPFTIEANSAAEYRAELAKLNARHERWMGEI